LFCISHIASTQAAEVVLACFPAAQVVHFPEPILGLYVPDTQPRQEPIVPFQLAAHPQTIATACESSPVPQSVHAADPGAGLYFPATQPVQSPFDPDQAALQMQNVLLSLARTDVELGPHGRHVDLSSAE